MKPITKSHIEQSAIETLQAQGWAYLNGKDISPEGTFTKPPRSVDYPQNNIYPLVQVFRIPIQLAQGLPTNAPT